MCDGQHQRGDRGSAKACFGVVDVNLPSCPLDQIVITHGIVEMIEFHHIVYFGKSSFDGKSSYDRKSSYDEKSSYASSYRGDPF